MYWFQDMESARALGRLYSKPAHLSCGDGVPQGDPDHLPASVSAEPLIDEPSIDDAAPGSDEPTP
jgi:hypothetical protein